MNKTARFLIPLAILVSVPAFAQTQYRFELFAALDLPQDKQFEISYPQSSVPMKGTHEYSPGARGGVRFGTDGKQRWGQEFNYSYGANASTIVNHYNGGSFSFTPRSHQFSYNVIWYPLGLGPTKSVFPYLTAGVGATFYTLSQQTVNEALDPNRAGLGKMKNESIFAFNAGGGVRFRINSIYGLRIDVRDYVSDPPRYGLPEKSDNPSQVVFPVTGKFHQIEVSIGFVYYFKE
jgi:hypothetical protein